jgi:hypothetical protein
MRLGYEFRKLKTKLVMAFVWSLPRGLVYWCFIRIMAYSTTGKYGDTVVPELTGMDALQRWEDGMKGPYG